MNKRQKKKNRKSLTELEYAKCVAVINQFDDSDWERIESKPKLRRYQLALNYLKGKSERWPVWVRVSKCEYENISANMAFLGEDLGSGRDILVKNIIMMSKAIENSGIRHEIDERILYGANKKEICGYPAGMTIKSEPLKITKTSAMHEVIMSSLHARKIREAQEEFVNVGGRLPTIKSDEIAWLYNGFGQLAGCLKK